MGKKVIKIQFKSFSRTVKISLKLWVLVQGCRGKVNLVNSVNPNRPKLTLHSMYNSTIYYNLKLSIYRCRRSINLHTEKIRLWFCANLLCPFSSWVGFEFPPFLHLDILGTFFSWSTSAPLVLNTKTWENSVSYQMNL